MEGADGEAAASSTSTSTASDAAPTSPGSKMDVSIPYDAAAQLAYKEWKSTTRGKTSFSKFNEIYEKKVVAQVTAKKSRPRAEVVRSRREKKPKMNWPALGKTVAIEKEATKAKRSYVYAKTSS